jgi:capsid protein
MPKSNWFSRLLGFASAEPNLQQKAYGFEGANYSTARSMIYTPSPSDFRKEMTTYDRKELVRRTRYLEKNSGFLREYINTMQMYSVGDGIGAQPLTDDPEWNALALEYWHQFSLNCEITRRFNLREIQTLICRALDRDGEIFILKVRGPNNQPMIQLLESHRIGGDDYNNPLMSDGVLFNSIGQVVAYRILTNDGSTIDKPWGMMMHIYDPQQYSGARGYPPLPHAINHLIDQSEMLSLEKQAAKDQSKISMVLHKPGGSADPDETPVFGDSPNTNEANTEPAQRGITFVADEGEKVEMVESKRPNSTFMGFLDAINRDAALGGLPFEFIVDPSKIGGAVVRLVVAKAGRCFSHRQRVLTDRFLYPLWLFVIGDAINRGLLPDNPKWNKVGWVYPRNITVDAGRDTRANIAEIEMGTKLFSDELGENGTGSVEAHFEKRAQEAAIIFAKAKKYNLPVEYLMKYSTQQLSPSTPNTDAQPDRSLPPEQAPAN